MSTASKYVALVQELRCLLFAVPDGLLPGGLAPAAPLPHVGIADVEVGDRCVALFQAQELAHMFVVGDGAGAPHRREAQGVGCELHVLDGCGARRVVLEGLDLVAAGLADHGYDDRGPEGLLALAADPARGHLLALALGFGLEAGYLGAGAGELAAPLATKDVEAPRLGEPVVRSVHGALEDALDQLSRHRVLLHASDALAGLYGANNVHGSSILSRGEPAERGRFTYHFHNTSRAT